MARPSICSPLSYVVGRQVDDRINYCRRLVNARIDSSDNLFRKDLLSHYGCVNAIEFSNEGDLLISGGDDSRVLLWKVEQAIQGMGKPAVMRTQHVGDILSLGYDSNKSKIFSAGNDDQVIVHDLQTGDPLKAFRHEETVYSLSIHPHNDNVFSSACDDGRVLIYDIRDSSSTKAFCLAQYKTAFHSVMFNPVEPSMLATANAKEGVGMWDVRKPLDPVLRYSVEDPSQSCMNVRYNAAGTRLLALRSRLPPTLYAVDSPTHICQFYHPGYLNCCTMKSSCFAGDDRYVLSGSDDTNLYMWKIPTDDTNKRVDSAHMILRGHRSIVNQVRFNQSSCIFASSGVEKIIKIWSPFTLGTGCLGGLKGMRYPQRDEGKRVRQRDVLTYDEYFRSRLCMFSSVPMNHYYNNQSTKEDPQVISYYFSLVLREMERRDYENSPPSSQTSSDSENNPTTERTYSVTDPDVRSRGNSGGGVAPERLSESPNRITRLVANRKEKLMRLAALEGGATVNAPTNTDKNHSALVTVVHGDEVRTKAKSKFTSNSKGAKRKYGVMVSSRTCRSRRKLVVPQSNSDSDSDAQPLDSAQPSTSSGVVSRMSRYATTPVPSDKQSSHMKTSEKTPGKRRRSKIDSDSSTKAHRRKLRRYKNTKRDSGRSKNERRQPVEDSEESMAAVNGKELTNSASTGSSKVKGDSSTPGKRLTRGPPLPDSGIASGISTMEKLSALTHKGRTGADSSDHDRKLKSLEHFGEKVDDARRGYRNRSARLLQPASISTDSSDLEAFSVPSSCV